MARSEIAAIRKQLLRAVARPACPLAPKRVFAQDDETSGLHSEKWTIQTEPGARGRVPIVLIKQIPVSSSEKLPVVIVLHGTGGSKEGVTSHLERYARSGYLAVAFDTRYHGERAEGGLGAYYSALIRSWEFEGGEQDFQEHPFMFDSTHDSIKVLDFLETERDDADITRIGMTGISLGGMHTWFTAVADDRIAAAAPAIGVQGFAYAVEHGLFHARVGTLQPLFDKAARDLAESPSLASAEVVVTPEVVSTVWDKVTPGLLRELDGPSSLRCIAPRPLLVMNGALDPRCPATGVVRAVDAAREEYEKHNAADKVRLVLEEGVAHAVTPRMWQQIDQFFEAHFLRPLKSEL